MKKTRSFRIDQESLEKLDKLNVNINWVIRMAIDKLLKENPKCPLCNNQIKGVKNEKQG